MGGVITTPRVNDSMGLVWVLGWWVGDWWWLRARQSGLGSGVCGVGVRLGECGWLVCCLGGLIWVGGVITTPRVVDSLGLMCVGGW